MSLVAGMEMELKQKSFSRRKGGSVRRKKSKEPYQFHVTKSFNCLIQKFISAYSFGSEIVNMIPGL